MINLLGCPRITIEVKVKRGERTILSSTLLPGQNLNYVFRPGDELVDLDGTKLTGFLLETFSGPIHGIGYNPETETTTVYLED